MNKTDAVRALIESARAWRAKVSPIKLPHDYDLSEAIDAFEAVFTVAYEEKPFTMWQRVRDGDLVKTPRGDWVEVIRSVEGETPATQRVTFRINGQEAGPFDRPAESRVDVRRPRDEMNAAIDLFAESFNIRAIDPEQVSS